MHALCSAQLEALGGWLWTDQAVQFYPPPAKTALQGSKKLLTPLDGNDMIRI